MKDVLFSKKTDEWNTPKDLFDKLNNEFNFDIDLCSTKESALCKNFFTKEDNSLSQDWSKFRYCWCNPPYSNISNFVEKAYNSKSNVVMLIPSRTDTKWFHNYIYNQQEIRFIKGRLKFSNSKGNAPFPSMIVIFKNKI